MKRGYLPTIPEYLILFIDNSAFKLEDYEVRYPELIGERKKYRIPYLKENRSRLEKLTTKLFRMTNWTTIKEVIEEFKEGNKYFRRRRRIEKCRQLKAAYTRILHQRTKTLRLLNNKYRLADYDLTDELKEITNTNEQLIENIFKEMGGVHKNRKTDTKLINIALAYATQELVCVFSHDNPLLRTFIKSSKEFGLSENSYVLADKFYTPIKITDIELEGKKFIVDYFGKIKIL